MSGESGKSLNNPIVNPVENPNFSHGPAGEEPGSTEFEKPEENLASQLNDEGTSKTTEKKLPSKEQKGTLELLEDEGTKENQAA